MITVVGLSHRTAPIAVREELALSRDVIPHVLEEALAHPEVREAFLVSTCNRVELFAAGASADEGALADVAAAARSVLVARAPRAGQHLYARLGGDAVQHLFRVAASLDSMVLGEPQILGQVKDAFDLARAAGTVGTVLHRTVPRALKAAKRVRTETSIGAGQVSVPSVGVDLAKRIFGDLSKHTVALIGSGEMAETTAKLLRGAGARLLVVGRNPQRVGDLAARVGGEGRDWNLLLSTLVEADVVITSTSAPHHVVSADMVASSRRARRGRSLFFIDLAVPRDVDPRVEELDFIFLYNVDDLSQVVADSLANRQREADAAERIIAIETAGWQRWADAAQVTPVVVALRERFAGVLEAEAERSLRGKLRDLDDEQVAALRKLLEAALKKLLHGPTVKLRQCAADPSSAERTEQLVWALNELFALESADDPESGEADDEPDDDEAAPAVDVTGVRAVAGRTGAR